MPELVDRHSQIVVLRLDQMLITEVVMVRHCGDGSAARAVRVAENSESEAGVLRGQCFAMVPLAYGFRMFRDILPPRALYH